MADPYCYLVKTKEMPIRVLDGDTISVVLELGFDMSFGPKALRFFGLNAPEIHDTDPAIQKRAKAAMDFVSSRLLPSGPTAVVPKVKVETKKPDSSDKFGRILATVFYQNPPAIPAGAKKGTKPVEQPWVNLNNELLAAGLAKPYMGEGVKPV